MSWSIWQSDGERKYLTSAEVQDFIKASHRSKPHIYLLCRFLAVTGCRISEALNVRSAHVSAENRLVIIQSLKKRRQGIHREVPLPTDMASELADYIASNMLRPGDKIWPISRMTAYRHVRSIMKGIGLSGAHASPKGLRHGFAIEAIQAGVPLNIVQRWLGHASMTTTAIYTSAIGPEELRLADRMWANPEGAVHADLKRLSGRMAARRESLRGRILSRTLR